LIDQRNHGQSPQSDDFNYKLLAEDLHEFIQEHKLQKPNIIGHSMGGKTAMNFAVKYPDQLNKLIIVDIAPKQYPVHHDKILQGLQSIDLVATTSRSQADEALSKYVPEVDVRQFLLKNLYRTSDGKFGWRINLSAINKHIEEMGAGMQYDGTFKGTTLFLMGARSNYFAKGDESIIADIFPNATIKSIDSGHWVQAEKPEEFAETVNSFLAK
jgi:pimeloyl-ACP methyl ester carboxylesterase